VEDTKDLWNTLKEGPLKSMRDEKGLIKLLREKHISRMWEIAACKYEDIEVLMAPNDAAAAVKAALPGTWIGKRGEKKGGWDASGLTLASSSNGFPFKEDFEVTISAPDHLNQYPVEIIKGIIEGKSFSFLSIEWSPTSVPRSTEHYVAAFTFGNHQNVTDRIIVYIRFASSTVLVGKAFKANWKDNVKYQEIWRDIILAKSN